MRSNEGPDRPELSLIVCDGEFKVGFHSSSTPLIRSVVLGARNRTTEWEAVVNQVL